MSVYDVMVSRRTIRKFKENQRISQPHEVFKQFINGARMAPSAANRQPLKYVVIHDEEGCDSLFQCIKWAGYLPPEVGTPKAGERPVAYIIVLVDTDISKSGYEIDIGASAQNITLAALEKGIASCWFGAVDHKKLQEFFSIEEKYQIGLVMAFGYPAEEAVAEEAEGSIRYYKDDKGIHHVPKRKLEDIILTFGGQKDNLKNL